jgi:hypothetical protein
MMRDSQHDTKNNLNCHLFLLSKEAEICYM